MSKHDYEVPDLPADVIQKELRRERHKGLYRSTLRSTVGALLVVAALAVLAATALFPVLRIYGSSMTPTVDEGEIVVALKGSNYGNGDVVALYYGNKLLVKRVIAGPGQWVDIDKDGNTYVDGKLLDEPYVSEKSYEQCDIELPIQVPDGRYFVMGDHRSTSADSRTSAVGFVAEEQVVGQIVFRIWPLGKFGAFARD